MPRPLEFIAKAGMKYREFAYRRLRVLTALRKDLRLPALQKQYKIGSSHIWVRASEFGDVIRITGGVESSLVLKKGLDEWIFFDWDGVEAYRFDTTGQPYEGFAGGGTAGSEICAVVGESMLVGTTDGSSSFDAGEFWLVGAVQVDGVNPVIAGPRPMSDFWPVGLGLSATLEGFSIQAFGLGQFSIWTDTPYVLAAPPFFHHLFRASVVGANSLVTSSVADSSVTQTDLNTLDWYPLPGGPGLGTPVTTQVIDYDPNSGTVLSSPSYGISGSIEGVGYYNPAGAPFPESFLTASGVNTTLAAPGVVWDLPPIGQPLVRLRSPSNLALLAELDVTAAAGTHLIPLVAETNRMLCYRATTREVYHVSWVQGEAGPILSAVQRTGGVWSDVTAALDDVPNVLSGRRVHLINRAF